MKKKMQSGYQTKMNGFDMLAGLVSLFPLYYVVLISVANYADVRKQAIYIYPTSVNFEAYRQIFSEKLFLNAFAVTSFVTVAGTLLSLAFTTAAAYTLSKTCVPGQKLLFYIILIPMFFSGGLIPYYLTVKDIGLINQIWVMIVPGAVDSFYLIIMKSFFEDLPVSLEESAKIEGANDMYVLWNSHSHLYAGYGHYRTFLRCRKME